MSILDSIDTTVTLEWQGSRTIGTLVELGGRTAVLTTLRTPDKNDAIHIVVEGDLPEETVTIDGICRSVTETAWGEQQADIELMRVGTTQSASRLRDFIEEYGVQRGGSVHIGRNRDNPNRKRFVYHLPEISETIRKDKTQERQRRATISGRRSASLERGGQETMLSPSALVRQHDPSHSITAELANMSAPPFASSTPKVSGPPRSPSVQAAMPDVSKDDSSGFDEDPGDTLPNFDLLADAFVSAPPGHESDLGFEGAAMRTNPDTTSPNVPSDASLAVTNELDQALREALEAVEQPRPAPPSTPTPSFEESAPTHSFESPPIVDAMPDVGPVDGLEVLPDDDPFADEMEVSSALVTDELEPTPMIEAVRDEAEESIESTENYGSLNTHSTDDELGESLAEDVHDYPQFDTAEDINSVVSEELSAKVDDAIALERAFSDSEHHDPDEPIIVNTVAHEVPFADPVKLGHDNQAPSITTAAERKLKPAAPPKKKKKKSGTSRRTTGTRKAETTDTVAPPKAAAAPAPSEINEQLGVLSHGQPSDALIKVHSVFGVDLAVRCDLPVIFGSGRAKRDGQLLRLAESRLRIASAHQPGLYERLNVLIPDPAGGKAKVNLDCEVTRIREPDDDEAPIAFDMRLAGSNSPKQMQALRKLIRSFEAPPA